MAASSAVASRRARHLTRRPRTHREVVLDLPVALLDDIEDEHGPITEDEIAEELARWDSEIRTTDGPTGRSCSTPRDSAGPAGTDPSA